MNTFALPAVGVIRNLGAGVCWMDRRELGSIAACCPPTGRRHRRPACIFLFGFLALFEGFFDRLGLELVVKRHDDRVERLAESLGILDLGDERQLGKGRLQGGDQRPSGSSRLLERDSSESSLVAAERPGARYATILGPDGRAGLSRDRSTPRSGSIQRFRRSAP